MRYAIGEILVFLIISAVIGGLFGFVLSRSMARREVEQRLDQSRRSHASEMGQIRARLDERNVEIVGLNDQLAESQGRMRAMQAELETGASTDSDFEQRLSELTTNLDEANVAIRSAETARDEAVRLSDDALRQMAEAEAKASAFEKSAAEAQDLASTVTDRDRRIEELETQLADLRRRADAASAIATAQVVAESDSGSRLQEEVLPEAFPAQLAIEVPADSGQVAATAVAAIAARTRGDAKAVHDDLTRIRGIGPKIGGMLKSMEITSFRQLANLTDPEVEVISDALGSFPDRIQRDDWMTSARELHESKYGSLAGLESIEEADHQ